VLCLPSHTTSAIDSGEIVIYCKTVEYLKGLFLETMTGDGNCLFQMLRPFVVFGFRVKCSCIFMQRKITKCTQENGLHVGSVGTYVAFSQLYDLSVFYI
jgi:hypothetical protein